jgi:hypothetical protein
MMMMMMMMMVVFHPSVLETHGWRVKGQVATRNTFSQPEVHSWTGCQTPSFWLTLQIVAACLTESRGLVFNPPASHSG